MRLLGNLALMALILFAAPAGAQAPPQALPSSVLAGYATISATSTSGRVALPAAVVPFNTITLFNAGTNDLYFATGSVTVAATTSSPKLPAGTRITLWNANLYVAAITSGADTATLHVYQSNGPIYLGYGP